MRVVVIGGTGLIGSRVADRLRDHGADVMVASPRTGVDAYTGAGLLEVLDGAHVVVDATNLRRSSYDDEQAADFFETGTRNLLTAEEQVGVQHHVGVSVIGAERIESSYFRGKAAQETLVTNGPIPYTLLRSTLLYDFVPMLLEHSATPRHVRVPPIRVQPVAADDVVAEIARLALHTPLNGRFEIAGPEERFLDELVREVLAATGDARVVMADASAPYLDAQLEPDTEALLPAWRRSERTYKDWLSA
jgi:uncharacterized protein YbjT (DUF2867 family)